MAITNIGDVIQPEVFVPYVIQRNTEKSALIQSGIVKHDPAYDVLASGPNTLIQMPFWEDLEGDSEVVTATGAFTPKGISASKDQARKQVRGNAWGANGLSALLSGADPMGAIANLVANYWVREDQKILLKMLEGVFKSPSMAEHTHDISGGTGDAALFGTSGFVDATQLLGDAKDGLTAVMMHSVVEAYLVKQKLIEYVEVGQNEYGVTIKVPYYMGKRVIVDDAMPFDSQSLTGTVYLFGQGAIALGHGKHERIKEVETARDSMAHSGEDYLIHRKIFLLHPRGIKWTEANVDDVFPTNDELADGSNYELVFDKKDIRIVKHTFKIKL